MTPLVLYHRTTIGQARDIAQNGFQDQKWGFIREDIVTAKQLKVVGIWLTDRLLGDDEGPPGDAMLEVKLDATEDSLQPYEIEDVIPDGHLWVVPAELLNRQAKTRIHSVDPRTSWFYDRRELEEQ